MDRNRENCSDVFFTIAAPALALWFLNSPLPMPAFESSFQRHNLPVRDGYTHFAAREPPSIVISAVVLTSLPESHDATLGEPE